MLYLPGWGAAPLAGGPPPPSEGPPPGNPPDIPRPGPFLAPSTPPLPLADRLWRSSRLAGASLAVTGGTLRPIVGLGRLSALSFAGSASSSLRFPFEVASSASRAFLPRRSRWPLSDNFWRFSTL